jgi:hypothetical protein
MAITVTVNPVIPSGDGGYELLARSIMAGQEIKRKREEEIQKTILAQRDANQKLFGSTQENLRTFYKDAANVPAEVRNSIFNQGVQELKAAANTPEFQAKAQEIANKAFQLNNTYSSFYKGVADASKVLADEMGMDQASILSFANKSIFEEQKDMQGNVTGRSLRDISNIADPVAFIRDEVMAHPEVYTNRTAMDTGAFKEMDDMRKKDADIKSDLKIDPTGKKTLSLGYNYKLSPFESEEERTDNVTGLKYKVPVLKEVISTISIPGTKDSYKELDPVKYEQFVGQAGPMTKKKLYIGAIDYIRDHNAKVLEAAGVPNAKDVALTISKNNVNMFDKMPGFINPFNSANIESFERIYAKDFLRLAKQYDEKGEAKEFTLNRGVDIAKPPITVNIGDKSATGLESKPYHPTTIVQGIIENRGGFRGATVNAEGLNMFDVTDAFSSYKPFKVGSYQQAYQRVLYSPEKNRFYYSLSPTGKLFNQSPDQFQSSIIQSAPDLGFKADPEIFRSLPKATQPAKTITADQFKKMNIQQRTDFINSGGVVK